MKIKRILDDQIFTLYFEADALRGHTLHEGKSTATFLQLFENHLNELKLTVLVQTFLIKFSLFMYQVKLIFR